MFKIYELKTSVKEGINLLNNQGKHEEKKKS